MTLICKFMSESNAHFLFKTGRKENLQKTSPRWEVAQMCKARTETLLSVPYIAPVIVPDILPPENGWKDICFLSDSALCWAPGSCLLNPLSLTASTSGEGKKKKKKAIPSFQPTWHGQCGLCRDDWWDAQNQSFRFRLCCQQVRRYFKAFAKAHEAVSPGHCCWCW